MNIQVDYHVDIVRPVDLHFDVLLEPEKKWLSGNQMALTENNGSVSLNLTFPNEFPMDSDSSRLLWKIFITPHRDRFPNMLAETGLAPVAITSTTGVSTTVCPYLPLQSNNVTRDDVDFVLIDTKVDFLQPVRVVYALRSQDKAILNINLVLESTNEVVWSSPIHIVSKTHHGNRTLEIGVPSIALESLIDLGNLYFDVSIVPIGSTWDQRLAEDRTYQVFLSANETR